MTMSVGVNLLWLVPGVVGGSESYAVGLLSRLVSREDVTVTAFALPAFVTNYPELARALATVEAPLPQGRHVVRRVLTENSWLPSQLRSSGIDVVHHLGGLVPRSPVPAVVTLHDLQYLAYPEYFTTTKRGYLAMTQKRSLDKAHTVIAISEFTRLQAIERFGLDAAKVVVVPPVVTPISMPDDAERARARKTFELTGDFVLYPAATYPHKNHVTLVRAFAEVARVRDVTLVLTGASGAGAWGSARSTSARIAALAGELGVGDRVRMLGYVGREQLASLYAEAAMVAFPSKFEGFGLPVVEAMSLRCPVVAASSTALPEVVGDGGLLVDPDDVDAWARAMADVLDDSAVRTRLIKAGDERATMLALRDPAETLVDVYRAAAG
jgi:glycosyltransferase involved in cell wall biosynthesis